MTGTLVYALLGTAGVTTVVIAAAVALCLFRMKRCPFVACDVNLLDSHSSLCAQPLPTRGSTFPFCRRDCRWWVGGLMLFSGLSHPFPFGSSQGNVKDMENFIGFFKKLRDILNPQSPIGSVFFMGRQVKFAPW